MSTLMLEIVDGPDAGRSVPLVGALEIGRDPSAGVRLVDSLVSRHHARIRADSDGAVIEDLGSSNGTFVNADAIVEPTRVTVGDELLIGSCTMLLRDATPAAASPGEARAPSSPPPPAGTQSDTAAGRPDEPALGSLLAGYRLEARVGRGAMGVVYRAEELRVGRTVALKLLSPDLVADGALRTRFETESRLAAAIDHPHVIPLYDAGEVDGLLFLTMHYVDGLDLRSVLRREGPLALDRAVSIVAQVGDALDAVHARGIVHRDVKPGNILMAFGTGAESCDHCYLTDFGLARDTSSPQRLTGTDYFVGTIAYVAPEQIHGDVDDGAADQYSLACVLYECLTGHRAFERTTELDVMWAHLGDAPPAATDRRPDLPPAIDAVLARAMAKTPEERYASCAALAVAARATSGG